MTTETSIYDYAQKGLEKDPDKTALWFYGRALSYRELFSGVDDVAEQLSSLGIGPGSVVTIHLPNCPQTVMAIYAVAKLGGISNMVHALLPTEGLRKNMAFTESKMLITGNHVRLQETDFADIVLNVNIARYMGLTWKLGYSLKAGISKPKGSVEFGAMQKNKKTGETDQTKFAKTCAVYMHSSGSTGDPKTVMLSHTALNNWVEKTKHYFQHEEVDKQVFLSVLPYFHASGFQMDMHRVLNCGGTLVLMSRWDVKTAIRLIKKHSVTALSGVPAICRSLLEQEAFSGPRIKQLRNCYIGGEKMDALLKQKMEAHMGIEDGPHVFEGYGLTETSSAIAVVEREHYHIEASGYPQRGVICMVRQEDGTLSEQGHGEFVIGADCLMMGYLKDPKATEQTFIEWNGQKMLRTGDYGYIDETGLLFFEERIKNVIVKKGNNIFPHEIETIIRGISGIADVCVFGISDNDNQKICAVVVPSTDVPKSQFESRIIEECERQLPRISVPEKIIFTEHLPKTQTGKIDIQLLRKKIL